MSVYPELLNCGTHCHPLLSLNPTICHLLNLTSTNLILSPFLLKLPLIFSVFPFSRLCYRPYGLSPALLTKKKIYRLLTCSLCKLTVKVQEFQSTWRGYSLCTYRHSYQKLPMKHHSTRMHLQT